MVISQIHFSREGAILWWEEDHGRREGDTRGLLRAPKVAMIVLKLQSGGKSALISRAWPRGGSKTSGFTAPSPSSNTTCTSSSSFFSVFTISLWWYGDNTVRKNTLSGSWCIWSLTCLLFLAVDSYIFPDRETSVIRRPSGSPLAASTWCCLWFWSQRVFLFPLLRVLLLEWENRLWFPTYLAVLEPSQK